MKDQSKSQRVGRTPDPTDRHGRTLVRDSTDEGKARTLAFHPDQPRASSHINDNHCSDMLQVRLLAGSSPRKTLSQRHVNFPVVSHVRSATGLPQRKGLSPGLTDVNFRDCQLKYVKGVSSVTHLSYVKPVTNVKLAQNLPVGARLQNFWKTWMDLGAGPKVVKS